MTKDNKNNRLLVTGDPLTINPSMRDDSSTDHDLETLKIAARAIKLHDGDSRVAKRKSDRNDIVHAGYRILQCVSSISGNRYGNTNYRDRH